MKTEVGIEARSNVRARALRAAQVVTLGLAIASVPACTGRSHLPDASRGDSDSGALADTGISGDDGGPDGVDSGILLTDAGRADSGRADAGRDGGSIGVDSGVENTDAGAVADAGTVVCDAVWPPRTPECCAAEPGGFWDESSMTCVVAVPGPFVPPSETARA